MARKKKASARLVRFVFDAKGGEAQEDAMIVAVNVIPGEEEEGEGAGDYFILRQKQNGERPAGA
jgi:hypothetical protein